MNHISYKGKRIELISHVYEPSEDSILLVDALLEQINYGDRVLEVGCGSGIVSVFAAERTAFVVATDINPFAVQCARINGIEAIRTDLCAAIDGKFDLVIFNPPYLPTSENEHQGKWEDLMLDGGSDGRRTIERFLEQVGELIAPGGKVLLLVSSYTGIPEVCDLMEQTGLRVEIISQSRYFFEQLVVLEGTIDL